LDAIVASTRAEALTQALARNPTLICIADLPPGGNANARFLCRRLRAQLPNAFIVALVPEPADKHSQETAARLREAGANVVVPTILAATQALTEHATEVPAASSATVAFAG
jgi:hypothetical protein